MPVDHCLHEKEDCACARRIEDLEVKLKNGLASERIKREALAERAEKAERELRTAREDTARLDWVDAHPTERIVATPTVREAIDAAREEME